MKIFLRATELACTRTALEIRQRDVTKKKKGGGGGGGTKHTEGS